MRVHLFVLEAIVGFSTIRNCPMIVLPSLVTASTQKKLYNSSKHINIIKVCLLIILEVVHVYLLFALEA
jgi:hypothetical protein